MREISQTRFREIIRQFPDGRMRFLDVGCGDGQLLKRLQGQFPFACGVDIDRKLLCFRGIPCAQGDILHLPFKDRSFDIVSCDELLEHLNGRIEDATNELARVSRELIVISVPWRECLQKGLVRCHRCNIIYHMSGHIRKFEKPESIPAPNGYRLIKCVQIVRARTRWQFAVILRLFQKLLGVYALPGPQVVCPSCGEKALDESMERNIIRKMARRLYRIMGIIVRLVSLKKAHSYALYIFRKSSSSPDYL